MTLRSSAATFPRIAARASAAAVVVAATLTVGGLPAASAAQPCSVSVAGDSITARSADQLTLALGPSTCVYGRPLRTSSVIVQAMLAKQKLLEAPVWVLAAGSNDALNGGAASAVARSMRQLQAASTQRGSVPIFWVDTYVDRYSAMKRARAVNQRIAEVAAASNGQITLVPWAAFLDEDPIRPLAYLVDGVHTTPEGSTVRSRLIADAVRGRSQVAEAQGTPRVEFELSRASGPYGTRVTGRVRVSGATEALAGRRVLLAQADDTRSTAQWVTLDGQGEWAGAVPLRASGPIRAFLPGTLADDEASATRQLRVSPQLRARIVNRASGPFIVASSWPAVGGTMNLEQLVSGRWLTRATAPGGRTATWKVTRGSTYRVVVPASRTLSMVASKGLRS